MSGSIRILREDWPIVVHVSEGSPTEAQFDAYVREATELVLHGGPHVVVMDASRLTHASSYGRMIKKDWLDQYGEALRKSCLGTAVVLSSPVLRFISSTIMLLRPLPVPYFVCETRETRRWPGRANGCVSTRGVTAPRAGPSIAAVPMPTPERLVFSPSVEALLIRGVGPQITPELDQTAPRTRDRSEEAAAARVLVGRLAARDGPRGGQPLSRALDG